MKNKIASFPLMREIVTTRVCATNVSGRAWAIRVKVGGELLGARWLPGQARLAKNSSASSFTLRSHGGWGDEILRVESRAPAHG